MKRDIGIAIISFVVGAAASFLVTRKLIEEKYVKLAQGEIDSVKEQLRRNRSKSDMHTFLDVLVTNGATIDEVNTVVSIATKYREDFKDEIDPNNIRKDDEKKNSNLVGNSSLRGTRTHEYNNTKQNYHLIDRQTEHCSEPDEDDAAYEGHDEVNPSSEDNVSVDYENPYVIDDISFSEEFINHDKLSIIYYEEDDVLADENEDIMDDVDRAVGYNNLNILNADLTHPDMIYVRNERFAIDYEITIVHGSYQELVQGVMLEPKQRQEISSRRRKREEQSNDD